MYWKASRCSRRRYDLPRRQLLYGEIQLRLVRLLPSGVVAENRECYAGDAVQ